MRIEDTESNEYIDVDWFDEGQPSDDDIAQMFKEARASGKARKIGGVETAAEPEPPGLLSRMGKDIGKAWTEATTPIESEGGMTDLLPKMGEKVLRTAGHVGAAAGDVMMTGIKGIYDYGVDPITQQANRNTFDYLANTDIGKSVGETVKGVVGGYRKLAEKYPRLATDIEAGASALNLIPAYQLIKGALPVAKVLGKEAIEGAGEVAGAAKDAFFPKPNPDEAMRQVLQSRGKVPAIIERDVEKGWKALSAIDTTGDKVFADTIKKIDSAIPEYAAKVDAELLKDPKVYGLDDLSTVQKTAAGTEVKTNYVKTALDNLDELYTKTEDPLKAANIKELKTKLAFAEEGLTKKEVNDIARIYGREFNAFNPNTGTPPTGVTKQTYENVREGLKEVARRGLSDTAKELDSTISGLMNTERLLEQNQAAAMRLKQKYAERGLGDKIGGIALDAINLVTLGGVKGLMRKAFPSNVGLKVRNSVEIEKTLERNLKIINREIERLNKMGRFNTGPQYGPPMIP